ncbi:MAG: alpha/beta fold hydrolase [Verrucomicrobiales bacterium]|jgi:lysophospholipase L1-like esterase/pimeloyl-ACP methyl ester carboxylesterase|nr:alpha/beta fold hydrolase [Verrucomicrobiales bacterium]
MKNLRLMVSVCLVTVSAAFAADPNAPVNPAQYQAPVKIACVGDSITAGVGSKAMDVHSYPARLQRMLDEKVWQVRNFGVSGATLLNNGDSPYQRKGQFKSALEWRPDVVIIALGTNDTKPQNWKFKDEFIADYKELINHYRNANADARIFICRPFWVAGQGNFGINEAGVLEEIPMLDIVAKDEQVGLIDLHEVLKDKPETLADRVHPNDDGYALIVAKVYETLMGRPFTGQMAPARWGGFAREDFVVADRGALIVKPESPAAGNPWIWRTEFFGHEPQADLALLKKGWHVAYVNVNGMYGSPAALDVMDAFFKRATDDYKLSDKVVLEGFSRGGLFAFNWAARHPGNVRSIYVDAPVLDFKSWPGGKGRGKGSPNDWKNLLANYKLTEEQALKYKLNPVDHLKPLADARIPILSVIGDADEDVPPDENTLLMETRYKELGGEVKVISKPGVAHHPHSLKDPAPIVDFILSN